MKSESLVIADQHAAVNTFPGLVHTARHTTKADNTRSRWANRSGDKRQEAGSKKKPLIDFLYLVSGFLPLERRQPSKVGPVIGVKS